jgi:hypothetical protein
MIRELRFRILTDVPIAIPTIRFECARYKSGQYQNRHGIPEDGLTVIPSVLREIARRISQERQRDAVVWYYGNDPVVFVLSFEITKFEEQPRWPTSYLVALAQKLSKWVKEASTGPQPHKGGTSWHS